MQYTAAVITVSDKASRGERIDTSGPAVRKILEDAGFEVCYTSIVPDEKEQIQAELIRCADEKKISLMGKIAKKMKSKYANFHYLKGTNFYGSDDVSIDGIHVNDAAFGHMAKILVGKIRAILKDGRK